MTVADWRTLDLSPGGRSLIEASAGTGKTWTIAALYLRLLIEQQRTPGQVVVATFSEAAAQELRERIRARVQQMASQADDPCAPIDEGDPLALWLHERLADADSARQIALRLRLALAEMDTAPIGTLHALCQRVLREQPFHAGSGFGGVTMVDGARLRRELTNDLWRQWTQGDAIAAQALPWVAVGRPALARALDLALRPGVRLPGAIDDGVAALLADGDAEALRAHADDASWFKRSDSKWRDGMRALAAWIDGADPDTLPDSRAVAEPVERQIKPARLQEAVANPVFEYVQRAGRVLGSVDAQRRLAGLVAAVPALQAMARERLLARGQRSFDSLIGDVHQALQAGRGLADALFGQWPVALVDEFQDTDAVQYAILEAIYSDASGAPRGRLAMIGDPKQAIYGFRGGDVHTYLRAAQAVAPEQRLPLAVNQRSTSDYVAACNGFFAQAGRRLTMRGAGQAIEYIDVAASGRQDAAEYTVGGAAVDRPLVFHYLAQAEGRPPPADARRRDALDGCAQLLVQLLRGGHAIGGVQLQAGDIAVLLPKNRDVVALRRRLLERGVPCVGAGRSSVFASDWARALQLHLLAAANPRDASALRAALATPLGGQSFAVLRDWRDSDAQADPRWQAAQRRVEDWHEVWQRRGVLALVQDVIEAAAVPLAALPQAERERALTDLRHLGELLQAREAEVPGQAELLAWLAQQREDTAAGDEDAAEEQSLRLESDARRVQLMTLHASKGLEFKVVLLPMLWDHTGRRDTLVAVHDGAPGRVLRNDDAAIEADAWEGQDERLRLLYVALTRASHACHVFALDPARPCKANTTRPWADPERSALDALLARVFARIGRPDEGRTLADAAAHVDWRRGWPAGDARMPPPAAVAATGPVADLPVPPPPPPWLPRRHSFSTLVRHERQGALEETAASDEATPPAAADVPPSPAPAHPDLQALQAWRGTGFGNALHDVLEQRVAGVPLAAQRELVATALRRRGVAFDADPDLVARIATRLDGVLAAQILPGLRLQAVAGASLRAEMGFDYLLDAVPVQRLRELLAVRDWVLPPLSVATLHGAMTGKIDLVFRHEGRFHVLDWKGNWLGDALQDYQGQVLQAAMDAHQYRLQALLYTVAVDRYLRTRLGSDYRRARDLGETIYLFVRAVGLEGDAGIWRERFDDALLDEVDTLLAGAEGAA